MYRLGIKKASDTTYWTGSTWLGSEQWLAATGETSWTIGGATYATNTKYFITQKQQTERII